MHLLLHEIRSCARRLITANGWAGACKAARERFVSCRRDGTKEGQQVWAKILRAVEARKPPEPET